MHIDPITGTSATIDQSEKEDIFKAVVALYMAELHRAVMNTWQQFADDRERLSVQATEQLRTRRIKQAGLDGTRREGSYRFREQLKV